LSSISATIVQNSSNLRNDWDFVIFVRHLARAILTFARNAGGPDGGFGAGEDTGTGRLIPANPRDIAGNLTSTSDSAND
jgi:hypothetical protein